MKLNCFKNHSGSAISFCFIALLLMFLCLPGLTAYAADYVPLAPIPGTIPNVNCGNTLQPGGTALENRAYQDACGTKLSDYLSGAFKVGIALAGVLAFLMIVLGGFQYLSTDAMTGKEEGKARVMHALGGLVLALAAYIILNTINPQLVNLNLNFGSPAEPKQALSSPGNLANLSGLSEDVLGKVYNSADTAGGVRKSLTKQIDEAAGAGNNDKADLLRAVATSHNALYRDAVNVQTAITNADSGLARINWGTMNSRLDEADKMRLIMLSNARIQSNILQSAGVPEDQIAAFKDQISKNNQALQKDIEVFRDCINKKKANLDIHIDDCRAQSQ